MVALETYFINFFSIVFITLVIALILQYFKQPTVIAYIITGIAIGPHFLKLIEDVEVISQIGDLGIVLLLFFVGMEIKPDSLLKNWKITVFGTLLQIIISILVVFIFGSFMDWELSLIIFFGFVISLSSTAVIIKILESKDLLDKKIGKDVFGILLVQDLAIIPMIIAISFIGNSINYVDILLQIVGLAAVTVFMIIILHRKELYLPFHNQIKKDHDLQLFAAFIICTGFAFLTGLFKLSTALGAFIAGLYISKINATSWAHERLMSLKIIFLAIFFISIGMLIQLEFLLENIETIIVLVALILLTNTFVNALIFRWFGNTWSYSLYAGSLLGQIGEFSFLFASIGLSDGFLSNYGYQMTISIISISLLLSPIWTEIFSWLGKKSYKIDPKLY